jgi:hypothetical protein
MTSEQFIEILDKQESKWRGCNAYQGLQIIAKYIDPLTKDLIQGASHDQIHSVNIEDLCLAGITKKDVAALGALNWHLEDGEYLSCFV